MSDSHSIPLSSASGHSTVRLAQNVGRQNQRHSLLTIKTATAVGQAWGRGDWCHVADAAIAAVASHLADVSAGAVVLDPRLSSFAVKKISDSSLQRIRELLECALEQFRENEGTAVGDVHLADSEALLDAVVFMVGPVTAGECLRDPSAARLGG